MVFLRVMMSDHVLEAYFATALVVALLVYLVVFVPFFEHTMLRIVSWGCLRQTILLARVDPADLSLDPFYQVVHERLEESYRILKNARDQDGNPFTIIRVPQAPIIFDQGHYNGQPIYYTPVTSYLNFVLTNNLVVLPAYHTAGDPDFIRQKDEQAQKVFQQVFKTRKVVTIEATELNYSGGGLHCITMHQPKVKKRSKLRRITENGLKRLKG